MVNVNTLASRTLAGCGVHPYADVDLYICTGQENIKGTVTAVYDGPHTIKAQVQSISDAALKHDRLSGDNAIARNIWLDGTAKGVDRITETGGDMVKYKGRCWLITALPHDFTQVGWVCATVTMQIKPPAGVQ